MLSRPTKRNSSMAQLVGSFCCLARSYLKLFPKYHFLPVPWTKRMASTFVETEKQGKVFLIAINRPAQRNAVNHETGQQLCDAFRDFESDEQTSVAVFYGKEGNFCAGYDLKELASLDPSRPTHEDSPITYAPMGPSKTVFSKPIIAAISGYAVAGGLELALMCDMRVAEEDAIMGVFCRRFGVPLIDGGTVRLPYLVGLSRALDLILTGRPVQTDEALSMGLVNRVVPVGNAVKVALELANEIASYPRECMLADRKSTMYAAFDSESLQDAMQFEHDNGKEIILRESVEGAGKFAKGSGRKGSFSDWNSKL